MRWRGVGGLCRVGRQRDAGIEQEREREAERDERRASEGGGICKDL